MGVTDALLIAHPADPWLHQQCGDRQDTHRCGSCDRAQAMLRGQRGKEADRGAHCRRRGREHERGNEEAPFRDLACQIEDRVALARERFQMGDAREDPDSQPTRTESAVKSSAKPPARISPAPSRGPMM